MRDEKDTCKIHFFPSAHKSAPLIIDSNMKSLNLKWNTNGSILAVSGVQFAKSSQGEEKEVSVVQFYDPFGQADDSGTHFTLTISNAIGTAIETKYIDFAPKFAVLTKQFAIVASGEIVLCWQFKALTKKFNILDQGKKDYRERSFHIDDLSEEGIHEGGSTNDLRKKRQCNDLITAITASENILVIARQSGLITLLSLPGLNLEIKYATPLRPFAIALNCNNTRLSVLDTSGVLKLMDITPKNPGVFGGSKNHDVVEAGRFYDFERKDVWDVKWSNDNPELFAVMEKTRIISYLKAKPKDLCAFDNLQIKAALLDEIFKDPESPSKEFLLHIDTRTLRDTRKMDRKDLALELRIRLADWFRVVQLIKMGGSGDDVLLEKAWNKIGDYYFDRQRWGQAITYYAQGRNTEKLVECYYIVEDYDSLEKIMFTLPDSSPLLPNLARKFVSVGLCDQAVTAYLKVGDVKAAIDTCVYLNKWNTAVELAEANKYQGIDNLLATYAAHLLEKKKLMSAVELYRKANYCQKSSKILFGLAQEAAKTGKSPLKVKKLYVLAALEVERYHQLNKVHRGGGRQASAKLAKK
ncbi:WD repeat-containing protein 35 [Phlyctochytrium bullatum]|nr:WD repeat-containing protein 35 [Phlyctochytrium bullatum]